MVMDSPPLVSCIMPTRNRRAFVGQAIWYFLRQDYPYKELIIVDDGEDAVGDLVPRDERIHYMHLAARRPVGAKRNLACEMSQGELIAHWDDDDWMSPYRLSVQVEELCAAGADVCGARDLLHYRIDSGDAWLYRYPPVERPWVAGCTLLYRRSAWAAHHFPEIDIGEDSAFVWQLAPERVHAIPDMSLYIALIHKRNTGAKMLSDPRWERRPLAEVSRLLVHDRDYYVALRHGRTPPQPLRSTPSTSTVTVSAPFMVYDGYGSMAEYLVLGMVRAGAEVNVAPHCLDPAGLSEELQEIVQHSRPADDAPVLYFSWPQANLGRLRTAGDLFINTMWESSRLPAEWTRLLNLARAVIVPTRFVAQACRQSGVTVPTFVVPEGIDPAVYHYEERPERAGLTTLIVGTVIDRKHTLEGIEAWKLAFADDDDARLIIKSRFHYDNFAPDDARISFVDKEETTRGIAHWYRAADVLLALGNEGFGLPLVEGMATGLPVVALNSEGQADVCEEAHDVLLSVEPSRWEPYVEAPYGACGVRGVPAVRDIANRLRWVASHRQEAREMGCAASAWVLEHRNIWNKGPAVLEIMEHLVQPPRPLRKARTIWVPSWRSPCGIAEYTAHLTETLPAMRIEAQLGDMRGVRLLHVQHESSLFDDTDLTRRVLETRLSRIPVVVTKHSVGAETQPWEGEADVLLALTRRGTETLRTHWPHKRVEYMPHGCPTWFPARKKTRGRVIGAFGFLEPHKGFWHLLDALRALPDTELLLFSYAKWRETEYMWEEAARGLPVRRIREFVPSFEVACRLADEADILVFWYDEAPVASASGAVRVGLATGVPVLASPTGWFQDLREMTFQPHDLVEGIQQLLEDTPLRERLTAAAQEYCNENSWPRIAERHLALWQALESA